MKGDTMRRKWTQEEEAILKGLIDYFQVETVEDFPSLEIHQLKELRSYRTDSSILSKVKRMLQAPDRLNQRYLNRCLEYYLEEVPVGTIHEKIVAAGVDITLKDLEKEIELGLQERFKPLREYMKALGIKSAVTVYKYKQWLKYKDGTKLEQMALKRILNGR